MSHRHLRAIERLAARTPARELVRVGGLPVYAFELGAARARATLMVIGGVHGTEPIGTDVALAYLEHALVRPPALRVIVVPLLNPVGRVRGSRGNGNRVDLMRNGPAGELGGTPLVGGQRLSPRLPWYMGAAGAPMEAEAAALCALVEAELFAAPSIAVDCHSGYGVIDRLWHPYARTRVPFPDQAAMDALARIVPRYRVEPVARVYTIRGDLWDHLYDRRGAAPFYPLTLEMGLRTTLFGTARAHLPLFDGLAAWLVSPSTL